MEWNVVVSLYQGGFRPVRRALAELGSVERSPYHNVLVMKVDDPVALLASIEQLTQNSPALYDGISRVSPAMRNFTFDSVEDFKEQAKSILLEWSPRVLGRSFHVRLHRRGGRDDLATPDAERLFDDAVLDATMLAGSPGKLSFTDPEVVIAIDTVDDRAGMAMWMREDLMRHRLLRPD